MMQTSKSDQHLLDKGYVPEDIPIEQLRAFLPSFIPLTPENTRDTRFGGDIRSHEYFAAPPSRIATLEEIAEMVEEEGGKLPDTVGEWEVMKTRAQRRAVRQSTRSAQDRRANEVIECDYYGTMEMDEVN